MSAALVPSLPARLAAAVDLLSRGLATSLPQNWGNAALALSAWTRLRRLLARFAALVAALEAGRLSASRRTMAGASRPPRREAAAATAGPQAPAVRLPGGWGWLLSLAPTLEIRIGRSQVESLLGDPDLRALLARAPQAGRILRPLCHMLGIETPAALRLQRRSRRPTDYPGGTEAGASGGDAPPAPSARPSLPPWLIRPASPPLPRPEAAPALAPPDPAKTGPPGT